MGSKSQLCLILTLAAHSAAAALDVRQLAAAATTTISALPASVTTIGEGNETSRDIVSFNNDSSSYYLGYRDADFSKPYAKYWNPVLTPLPEEVVSGLTASPWASALGYSAHEAADLLTRPGYLEIENGWTIGGDGTLMIAVRTDMPSVSGEAYDWWFAWHLVETARYKLWNPVAHQYAFRQPEVNDWTNKTYAERYFGMTSWVDEYVGQEAARISISFVDPTTVGFNPETWDNVGVETVVVAKIKIGGAWTTTDFDGESYLMHQIRRMPNGYRELRSRFFLAASNHGTPQVGHDLAVHCSIEMNHMNTFLPALFEEFKNTV